MAGAHSSILTRILAGLLLVILGFGGVAAFSAYQGHRTVESMRLINGGYLPLTQGIAEIRLTQSHVRPRIESLFDGDHPDDWKWLRSWRVLRVGALEDTLQRVQDMDRPGLPPQESRFLASVSDDLDAARRLAQSNEERYLAIESALAARDSLRAEGPADEAGRVENEIDQRMRRLQRSLREHINALGDRAEEDEKRTLYSILWLAAAALVIGVVVTVLSHRLLSPLRRLQEGAEAAAKGDLTQRMRIERSDEIGALAREFDGMLDALVARDALLRRQAGELVRSERLAAIGRMASHITHEVRNPLSSIGLNVELLEEEVAGLGDRDATKEARSLLSSIAKEVDRLAALTADYLRLARVPRPALETVDVADLLRSVLDFVAGELRQANVEPALEISGDVGAIPLDEGQIRQVLLNLVRNACEAMPGGGKLAVRVSRDGATVEIAVSDTGPGVSPAERERIFEPFHTSKESGTGLGLPLALQLVRGHGGQIAIEEASGGGARFVVRLPVRPADARAVDDHRAEERA